MSDKKKKERASNYEEKLKIEGSLDDVLRVSAKKEKPSSKEK